MTKNHQPNKKTRLKNEFEKNRRVNQVIDLLVRGKKRGDIILTLCEDWQCSAIWVDRYIQKAKLVMKEELTNETTENMNSKYDFLWNENIKRGDYKEARAVMDSKQKLMGIIQKLDITSGGEPISIKNLFRFDDKSE